MTKSRQSNNSTVTLWVFRRRWERFSKMTKSRQSNNSTVTLWVFRRRSYVVKIN